MKNIVSEAVSDIKRHHLASSIVFITSVILVFWGLLTTLGLTNIEAINRNLSAKNRIILFAAENIDLSSLLPEIKKLLPEKQVKYYSREDSAGSLNKKISSPLIGSPDVVPDYIEVIADYDELESVGAKLKTISGISDVVMNSSWYTSIRGVLQVLRNSVLLVALIISFMGITIVYYTSKVSASIRFRELQIMLLCGATPFRISLPYYVSSALLSLFGCIAGYAVYLLFFEVFNAVLIKYSSSWVYAFRLEHISMLHYLYVVVTVVSITCLGVFLSFLRLPKEGD
jgi:cell division protein FtsX